MTFAALEPPPPGAAGFRVVAGRSQGLRRLMLVAGRLPAGDVGPPHTHAGDEVLRVVSGEVVVRCGEQERTCTAGSVVVVPPGVLHGFRVRTETVLEVVAEYEIGTFYPVATVEGGFEMVEVHRPDMPWGRPPPPGRGWTSDEELREILDRHADPGAGL